jgi:hypothetical protein
MGSPDARAYSRNKRGIAGSLIWINFDRHALLNLISPTCATSSDFKFVRFTNIGQLFPTNQALPRAIPSGVRENESGLSSLRQRRTGASEASSTATKSRAEQQTCYSALMLN